MSLLKTLKTRFNRQRGPCYYKFLSTEVAPLMLGKYQVTPRMLFRIGSGKKITLREFEKQKKKGSRSFDYVGREDGLILPSGDRFLAPNGLSLRPRGTNMWEVLELYRGKAEVTIVPENIAIPKELILFHEHGDHYSLQTAVLCTPKELNNRLTSFLSPFETISKEEYFTRFPIA